MKPVKLYPKVAVDLFTEQLKWSLWFFSFVTIAHIIGLVIVSINDARIQEFFVFSSYSVAIFLLVCGIISAYGFMGQFVQQGITRKDLYIGTVLAVFALALAVTLIPLVITGIEYLISSVSPLPINRDTDTVFDLSSGWLLATSTFFLNVTTYYLVGWLIGVGYYRFSWIIGFGFIAIAIAALSLNSFFWVNNSVVPWIPYNSVGASIALSIGGSLVLIAVLLLFIRMLTRRIVIKL
ncbi:hypothetical protein [Planococcus donghaensis]|uniref:Uncharacterized protein n=1 Tax=Planococcus donghaensis TaxID=414778 RepID=A0A1C7EL77_9BACL|nr:hypothetical protein [Planococcus donghaensis]ANU24127.1 hypothetical protein BCM40_12525 [Planococcus donghaensis]